MTYSDVTRSGISRDTNCRVHVHREKEKKREFSQMSSKIYKTLNPSLPTIRKLDGPDRDVLRVENWRGN